MRNLSKDNPENSDVFIGVFVGDYSTKLREINFSASSLQYAINSGIMIANSVLHHFSATRVHVLNDFFATPNALFGQSSSASRLWFHFIGHGAPSGILLHDGQGALTHLEPEALAAFLLKFKSNQILVVLDCCHSGSIAENLISEIERNGEIERFCVISSTSGNELAWEDRDLEASCFTLSLLESTPSIDFSAPFFGIRDHFASISSGTSASAFALKRGAKQNPSIWFKSQRKSLGVGKALARRLKASLIGIFIVTLVSLSITKMVVHRLGVSPRGEIVIMRGPKFLSFTEAYVRLAVPNHSDILYKTGIAANSQFFSNFDAILNQELWSLRGRKGNLGIDQDLENLLSVSNLNVAAEISSKTLDFNQTDGELIDAPRDVSLFLNHLNPDQDVWPPADLFDKIGKCGSFPFSPFPSQAVMQQRTLQMFLTFQNKATLANNIDIVDSLVALTLFEQKFQRGLESAQINPEGLPIGLHGWELSLAKLIKMMGTARARNGESPMLSSDEAQAAQSLLAEHSSSDPEADQKEIFKCRDRLEYYVAVLGRPTTNFMREAWSEYFEDLYDIDNFDVGIEENYPAIPPLSKLSAMARLGSLRLGIDADRKLEEIFFPDSMDLDFVFPEEPDELDDLTNQQREILKAISYLGLIGNVPSEILQKVIDFYDTKYYDLLQDYVGLPSSTELSIVWSLTVNSKNLSANQLDKIVSLLINFEDRANRFLNSSQISLPSDQLEIARKSINDTLLLMWSNVSLASDVPSHWKDKLIGSEQLTEEIYKPSPFFFYPSGWSSTHPHTVASSIYGTKNTLPPQTVGGLSEFLTKLEVGSINLREISDPVMGFGNMTMSDPNYRYWDICKAVGRGQFDESPREEIITNFHKIISEGVQGPSPASSFCPAAGWIGIQSHADQAWFIEELRNLWAEEKNWVIRKRLAELILTTIAIDFFNQ